MSEELPRWAEHDAPEIYSVAKGRYRQLGPEREQAARMLERMELAQPADAASKAQPRKLWSWRLPLLTFAVGGVFWALDAAQPDSPLSRPVASMAESARPVAASAPHSIEVEKSAREQRAAENARPPVLAAAPRAPVRARALALDPTAELALLARARRVLVSGPERALVLTNEHRARYRSGQLVEERELLAIEALVNLGRDDEARRRAKSFAKSYPKSVHQHRLGVILERAAE